MPKPDTVIVPIIADAIWFENPLPVRTILDVASNFSRGEGTYFDFVDIQPDTGD